MFKKLLLATILSASTIAHAAEPVAQQEEEIKPPQKIKFLVDIPKGWVLNKEAAAEQGIAVVFYPEKGSWSTSPAVLYVRSADKIGSSTLKTIDKDLENYKNRSPNLVISEEPSLYTQDSKVAVIRLLKDSESGNLEKIAYIGEKDSVSILTLNARNTAEAAKAQKAFVSFVNSYSFSEKGAATADASTPAAHKAEIKQEKHAKEETILTTGTPAGQRSAKTKDFIANAEQKAKSEDRAEIEKEKLDAEKKAVSAKLEAKAEEAKKAEEANKAEPAAKGEAKTEAKKANVKEEPKKEEPAAEAKQAEEKPAANNEAKAEKATRPLVVNPYKPTRPATTAEFFNTTVTDKKAD